MRANLGLMDQVAALHWIRDNVAAFGGSPHNVTLFGVRRAAIFVNLLMLSPLAKGKIARVLDLWPWQARAYLHRLRATPFERKKCLTCITALSCFVCLLVCLLSLRASCARLKFSQKTKFLLDNTKMTTSIASLSICKHNPSQFVFMPICTASCYERARARA